MKGSIAIVGMGCRYPDADTVEQLFVNSLAQRRSFRTIPECRLAGEGYFDESQKGKDQSYARQAAVLKDFAFDRERFCVSKDSYEVTDMTHWLALTVAGETLDDVQFKRGHTLPRQSARVVLGNTLTGEFSRANSLRLRWPYVEGVVARELDSLKPHLDEAERERFLRDLEARYKSPFAVPNEDSLAGGLANTIAGRICNHFDFNGGGYTVDGACASSLLAVTDACAALVAGEAEMVLAGGVDLSIDPFELVGFSRTAALARSEMLVYDQHSEGFWPGEGCGFVALMRYEDALEKCEHILGVIKGWGVSSDGQGGLTRPERHGQMLALERTYRRAGYGIESVSYFEGHGTGTKVGDATELEALITSRQKSGRLITPAVISSIKANIGHTKAAAGLAGLLRATKCLHEKVLPPTTACREPHPLFSGQERNLAPSHHARDWSDRSPRRAGVSAMGFGGINTHITIAEEPSGAARTAVPGWRVGTAGRINAVQDTELFLFTGNSRAGLQATLSHLATFCHQCSRAELTDLAVELSRRASANPGSHFRAAVVAATPAELSQKIEKLAAALAGDDQGEADLLLEEGVFFSSRRSAGKIGFLFSGQGSPRPRDGGIHGRRFEEVRRIYDLADLPSLGNHDGTGFAQPAIVAASLAGLAILRRAGIEGSLALGHSLGELVALHWGGCVDEQTVLDLAGARGRAIENASQTRGGMVAVRADRETTAAALEGVEGVFIANSNSPEQTVVSGREAAIDELSAKLKLAGIPALALPVDRAFHTPAMQAAVPEFQAFLASHAFCPAQRTIISSVTGRILPPTSDLSDHLCGQLVSPVEFVDAATLADGEVDLFLEVGPGAVLSNLIRSFCKTPAISLEVGGPSMAGVLHAVGAAYVLNLAPEAASLFEDRFARPFDWNWAPSFLQNPCEKEAGNSPPARVRQRSIEEAAVPAVVSASDSEPLAGNNFERVQQIIAERTGLPAAAVGGDRRMLSDLHLNSITVGEILARAAAGSSLQAPADPTQYSNASVAEIAQALDHLAPSGDSPHHIENAETPPGLNSWVRYFEMTRIPVARKSELGTERDAGEWQLFGEAGRPAQQDLMRQLNNAPRGSGAVYWSGDNRQGADVPQLLQAAQRASLLKERSLLVVIQYGWGAGGFARSFSFENPSIPTLVINLAREGEDAQSVRRILREIDLFGGGFREVFLDSDGRCEEARIQLVKAAEPEAKSLIGEKDVILVSGGGKGISAECGFELAKRTGCALLILGRSIAEPGSELETNLERLRTAGIRVHYQPCDVTDAEAVALAVKSGTAALGGGVSGIVHGAGVNHPRLIATMSPADVEATVQPKITGLKNILASLDANQLKLLVTFSSIIGRIGLQGEGDYALANEWLSHVTEEFQARHPHCRCRAIEWSVWSGTGMGQRLGRIDSLISQGISPISIDDGIAEFMRLIETPGLPVSLIVSGRFGNPPTVEFEHAPLSSYRFLDRVPVFYPDTELVAECDLSAENDPYLEDHVLNSERLFPGVMALEAMAEAAAALTGNGRERAPVFREVVFRRAIVAPSTLRVTAVADKGGKVSVAIRCSTTQYQINHIEAQCAFEARRDRVGEAGIPAAGLRRIEPFDPASALYRNVLFQDGRFRRVEGYQMIEARRCCGSLTADGATQWFAHNLPQAFLLGDPGARDAALHAIQACIPHKTVIPVAVESIEAGFLDPIKPHRMFAEEIADRGEELVYDLTILDDQNRVAEKWRGLTLRVVGEPPEFRLNAPPLAAPFLERRVAGEMPEAGLHVSLTPQLNGAARSASVDTHHRPDGKPDHTRTGSFRSASYSDHWKLSVESSMPVGCDLQGVHAREGNEWISLLGSEGVKLAEIVANEASEAFEISATRVWTAREATKKAGLGPDAPLVLQSTSPDRGVKLASGTTTIYSSTIEASSAPNVPLCLAAALRPETDLLNPPVETPLTVATPPPMSSRAYELRHIVSFQETNVVGNVYFVNHLNWQGLCREMFLKDHCPEILDQLHNGLILATSRVSCEYLQELFAFDEIAIRMRLLGMEGNQIDMGFQYFRVRPGGEEQIVAKGEQVIACMWSEKGASRPVPIPVGLKAALEKFR